MWWALWFALLVGGARSDGSPGLDVVELDRMCLSVGWVNTLLFDDDLTLGSVSLLVGAHDADRGGSGSGLNESVEGMSHSLHSQKKS